MKQKSFKRGTAVVSKTVLPIPYPFISKEITAGTKGIVLKKKRTGDSPLLVKFDTGRGHAYLQCSPDDLTVASIVKQVPKVGDIFYTCWGYEQTNIDFYQVVQVNKSGATVVICPIAGKTVSRDTSMSGYTKAVKDSFTGTPSTKRVNYSEDGIPSFKIASYARAWPDVGNGEHFF